MSVHRFSIPGHATRRDFAIYVAVANRRDWPEVKLYVWKTGDNRDGCNPVISRAGNHFSFNDIHSQIRNKLRAPPHEFDFEYFYVSFDPYDSGDANRRGKVEIVNEMERQANVLLQRQLPRDDRVVLMNPHKNARRLSFKERETRARIASTDRIQVLRELIAVALNHVAGLLLTTAYNTMEPAAGAAAGRRER